MLQLQLQLPSIKGLSFACSALFLFVTLLTSPLLIHLLLQLLSLPTKQTTFMGCCPSHPYNHTETPPCNSAAKLTADRSPPLPAHDDVKETVKEVVTETHPPPSKSTVFDPNNLVKDRSFFQPKMLAWNKDSKSRIPLSLPLPPDDTLEDRASEICSRSEIFVSTTDNNSSSGALLRIVASKSEGRRSSSSRSPAKRPAARMQLLGSVATSASARNNSRRTQEHSPGRRGVARVVGGAKEDLGERSARRSRSPVTRVGRTESGRRADPCPGRSRRLNGSNREELIENPLVSLECFIFL